MKKSWEPFGIHLLILYLNLNVNTGYNTSYLGYIGFKTIKGKKICKYYKRLRDSYHNVAQNKLQCMLYLSFWSPRAWTFMLWWSFRRIWQLYNNFALNILFTATGIIFKGHLITLHVHSLHLHTYSCSEVYWNLLTLV